MSSMGRWLWQAVFLLAGVSQASALTILITVSNTPPNYTGTPVTISGSARYDSPSYPVNGAATVITLAGSSTSTYTMVGGIYSAQVGPVPAGVHTARVCVSDGSTSNCASLVVTVQTAMASQTITFPPISDKLTTDPVGLHATASSGLPVSFAVGAGPAAISGSTNLSFTGAGAVSIVASQAGNASWHPAPNVTNTFHVTKAVATVTLQNLGQTYDGTPKTVTATTVPPGLTVDITYDGSPSAPTQAGSYAVAGTINDPLYEGSASGTLVVSKALATVTLGDLTHVYDGMPKHATATTMPPGLMVDITYNGSPTVPIEVGPYMVVGTVNDLNYEGSATDTMSITGSNPWTALYHRGQPAGTYVLGDFLLHPFEFAINPDLMGGMVDYGLGQTPDGTGWIWQPAMWSRDEGSARVWMSGLLQFTSPGSWYYAGRFTSMAGMFFAATDWVQNSGGPLAAESYYFVENLMMPTFSVNPFMGTSVTRVQLPWHQTQGKKVMITMTTGSYVYGEPMPGMTYAANDVIGNQTVLWGSTSDPMLEVPGLLPGQTYTFTAYAENFGYYSPGATSSITMGYPRVRNTGGGPPHAPSQVYQGDAGGEFGCEIQEIEGTDSRVRVWVWHFMETPGPGQAGLWSAFSSSGIKTAQAPGVFTQTGHYFWKIQVDFGPIYGDDFWYVADSESPPIAMVLWPAWLSPWPTLILDVLHIVDPLNLSGGPHPGSPHSALDFAWNLNPRGNEVLVLRRPFGTPSRRCRACRLGWAPPWAMPRWFTGAMALPSRTGV